MPGRAVELQPAGYSRKLAAINGSSESHLVAVRGKLVHAAGARPAANSPAPPSTPRWSIARAENPDQARVMFNLSGELHADDYVPRESPRPPLLEPGRASWFRDGVRPPQHPTQVPRGAPASAARAQTAGVPIANLALSPSRVKRILCRGEAVGADERVGADVRQTLDWLLAQRESAAHRARVSTATTAARRPAVRPPLLGSAPATPRAGGRRSAVATPRGHELHPQRGGLRTPRAMLPPADPAEVALRRCQRQAPRRRPLCPAPR
jgi:hypothetical protein